MSVTHQIKTAEKLGCLLAVLKVAGDNKGLTPKRCQDIVRACDLAENGADFLEKLGKWDAENE